MLVYGTGCGYNVSFSHQKTNQVISVDCFIVSMKYMLSTQLEYNVIEKHTISARAMKCNLVKYDVYT